LPKPSDGFGGGFGAPDVSADGRHLVVPYVLRDDATDLFHQFIAVLGISSAGGLTNLPQSPVAVPGDTPGVHFDATGRFLFASAATGVDVYTFDPTNGTLTLQAGVEAGPFPTLTISHDLLFAASENHLYVFRIDASTGALTNTAVAAFPDSFRPQIAIVEH
jgi:6-phosphogluconolactonase (cycloisomerase 2 family)